MSISFLQAVNRVLRTNTIIRGDDDDITTFSDLQHNATLNLAIIAIQNEVTELVSDKLIPYEKAEGTVTLVADTRVYSFPSDFVQFAWKPMFYREASNRQIFEYPGGEAKLRLQVPNYKSQKGSPNWWYMVEGTTKRFAFYQTPDSSVDGEEWTYDYEKDVYVEVAGDTIPLTTTQEAHTFVEAASRRFKFLFENAQNVDMVLANDASYQNARARLIRLLKGRNPYSQYGKHYQ